LERFVTYIGITVLFRTYLCPLPVTQICQITNISTENMLQNSCAM